MSTPSRIEVEVRAYELDPYGHVNNAVFVNWLEHGRLQYLRDRGHTYWSVPETFAVRVVVVRTDLSFRAQVRIGDRLTVATRLARLGRTSFVFVQEAVLQDGRPAVSGEVTMVCVGADERPVPVPADLRALLRS